jgi:large subunit ribosomal protein L6
MSRIGRKPVKIKKDIKIQLKDGKLLAEGPKGKLALDISPTVKVKQQEDQLIVEPVSSSKFARSMFGTTRALINNILTGVSEGFKKELEVVGVGYKVQSKGNKLILQVGFSHPVEVEVPENLKVSTPSANSIVVEGIDKVIVGQFAANIRKISPPEPYKGKGIRYKGEIIRKKLGKALGK